MHLNLSPEISQQISEGLDKITSHPSDNFVELLKAVGLDPTKDIRGNNLSGVRLDDADVAGWNFSGCNLTDADMGEVRNITSAIFSESTIFENTLLPQGITPEMLFTQ